MSGRLIPSITVTSAKQLFQMAELAQELSPVIHLDVMDGKFVSTKSVPIKWLSKVDWYRRVEVHAMVNNLASLLPIIDLVKPRQVYLPVERGVRLLPMMAVLRTRHIQCGLAVNPTTSLQALLPFVRHVKSILVLAVKPGRYHAPLQPMAILRIRQVHRRWPKIQIVADGGMNKATIPRAVLAGATRIIVGSAVMLSRDPEAEWKTLKRLTSG